MENLVVIAVIALIVGLAVAYVIKEKKKGVKCIGCPNAKTCSMAQKKNCNHISDLNNNQ